MPSLRSGLQCILLAALLILFWSACRSSGESSERSPEISASTPPPVLDSRSVSAHEPLELQPDEAAAFARELQRDLPARPAAGLEAQLWATEQLIESPIAIDVDDRGRVYVTVSDRTVGHLDIRGHPTWTTVGLSHRSVGDYEAFLEAELSPARSTENADWLPDYNGDGSHDWFDFGVMTERLVRIADRSGDGVADQAQVLMEGLNEPITDVLGGLLVNEHGIYLGAAPHVWRLTDTTGDDLPDEMTSISYGYGVHPGFNGHGVSGFRMGPDGRVYWSVGDMGYNVVGPDGRRHVNPYQGAIFRSEADGSEFEVFAVGLRNTHEFDFDDFGNLISVDNDGDHSGEQERIVYIVEGSDSGWRVHWQWGKYTDPLNNGYNVWMDEELFKPRFAGQAAFVLPPIANYHSGPAGMVYNPGTALSEEWRGHFFVSEFTGSPATTNVHGFRLEEKGAGFELAEEKVALSGVLTVGLDVSPDGSLYLADWIDGWRSLEKGRIWRLSAPTTALQQETADLLGRDFGAVEAVELQHLLGHEDLRVRRKAQFELVDRRADDELLQVVREANERSARIHGLWGIWQAARRSADRAEWLRDFLRDQDAEIRAQAARVLGDVAYAPAAGDLIPLLQDDAARVRFFAAEAVGRMGYSPAFQPIVDMLARNDDEDVYLRHAGALALARIGSTAEVTALSAHRSSAVRLAAVVALRRMGHHGVGAFVDDTDEHVATEAARAINDDGGIEAALPALARELVSTQYTNEPLLRRAINANLRIGTPEAARRVAAYIRRSEAPEEMRAEAAAVLGVWTEPSLLDRVDGAYLGPMIRDPAIAGEAAEPLVAPLLAGDSESVRMAVAEMAGRLGFESAIPRLLERLENDTSGRVRLAALEALYALQPDAMEVAVRIALSDADQRVRMRAVGLIPTLPLSDDAAADLLALAVERGSLEERQSAIQALGELRSSETRNVLGGLIQQMEDGRLDRELQLDVMEAAEASGSSALVARVAALREQADADDPLAGYRQALYGGDARQGARIVYDHPGAQCMRCHVIQGRGSDVGPDLTAISTKLDREQLLEALVAPSARIAPGYGAVTLRLQNGDRVSGLLTDEDQDEVIVTLGDGEMRVIAKSNISERTNAVSSMPPMGTILNHRQLRDVVAFLAELDG